MTARVKICIFSRLKIIVKFKVNAGQHEGEDAPVVLVLARVRGARLRLVSELLASDKAFRVVVDAHAHLLRLRDQLHAK